MPDWVANKQARIRQAKSALEAESRSQCEAAPNPKGQFKFTHPESSIMKGPESFVQACNAQAVVDADSQVIVAQPLSDWPTNVRLMGAMLGQIKSNTGRQAQELSADARYCSEGNLALLALLALRKVRAYVATGKQRHGPAPRSRVVVNRPAPERCVSASSAVAIATGIDCASKP
jgi:hypothetical protein